MGLHEYIKCFYIPIIPFEAMLCIISGTKTSMNYMNTGARGQTWMGGATSQ